MRAHAPLARHLSRFSVVQPAATGASPEATVGATPVPDPPMPAIDAPTIEACIEAARAEVRATMEAEGAADRARLLAANAEATAQAVARARAEGLERDGEALAGQIAAAVAALRDDLAGQVAAALRPLFADALAASAVAAVTGTLERALSDPDGGGGLVVRGPAALLAAIEARLAPGVALTFVPDEGAADVSVSGRDICIRSRLADALAMLSAGEGA